MLIPNHPDDEVLAAYAADETGAVADPALTDHLAACDECGEVIADVRALRASLAELPDLRPHRPLQLLPPVDEPAGSDGLVTWVRRLFAPVMAAGATLALVGAVGTASPAAFESVSQDAGADAEERTANFEAEASAAGEPAAAAEGDDEITTLATPGAEDDGGEAADLYADSLPAERSPWPMVLFAGVALALGALLLRWIVVPRAG